MAGLIHTSDTIMRLAELPQRLVILGGGLIAAEFAHIFSGLRSQVTVINRSGRMLRHEDRDISQRFT
ncbi:NAD-binding protein, partial [Pseudomonas aeruginosa]|uniref:NAD-binding protein n=1 Tax=Pseudomonas aeruginosa TaxID=287 RepID=UPI00397B5F41